MTRLFTFSTLLACLTAAGFAGSALTIDERSDDLTHGCSGGHGDYLKVHEVPGQRVALRVAIREFAPADEEHDGPVIALVSVTHIGDASFFKSIDEKLRDYDLVLFEGVGPPGAQRVPATATDEQRAAHTRDAMRFIASIIETHKRARNHYPTDLDELHRYVQSLDPIFSTWARTAMIDGWGNPFVYEAGDDRQSFVLRSTAAPETDRNGRDDDAALMITSEDDSIEPLMQNGANIQKELAHALGLAYQLDSLPYGSENWRPSDMHFAQLTESFREHDADIGAIEPMTTGASFPARFAQLMLRAIGWLDRIAEGAVSDVIKVLMIEMLGDADLVAASMKQLGEGFETVILGERNQVVIDDLDQIMQDEPEISTIAVLYGAAHMADLAERLRDQLDYRPHGEPIWLTAISVNLAESAMEPRQLEQMRVTVRRMLRQQLRQME